MGWKQTFSFRDKRHVVAEVGGRELRFYPNRMALLKEARDLSAPVAKAVAVLFQNEGQDIATSVKRQTDGDFSVEDITQDAITEDMARFRAEQKDAAIESIFEAIADRRNQILLGRLFMDSLRDEFKYDSDRSVVEVEEFLYGDGDGYDGLDAPLLADLFKGWMMANAKVFGSTGESLAASVKDRMSLSGMKTSPASGEPSTEPSSEE